ncbi:MAG: DUF808 domain-containing protein [Pelistega sp.]|nr:DUF808 domain-containing protein [Pelistega sp.]
MAFASLFTLLDDVAAVLDDVAVMTKVAAKKTAGIVGDDLAVNANQLTGIAAQRELPVIWAVTKGSFINKAIIIPAALLIAYFSPMMITILLLIGGAYLAFEGMEKVIHHLQHKSAGHAKAEVLAVVGGVHADSVHSESNITSQGSAQPTVIHSDTLKSEEELKSLERTKVRGAIRTDFILSAEIIIIAMGVVANMDFWPKTLVMVAIGLGITVFVYGVVALIVKLDDMGLWLMQKDSSLWQTIGKGMITFMPKLMQGLAIIGTIAMFLVGGGIFTHNWPWLHELVVSLVGDSFVGTTLADLVVGMIVGLAVYLVVSLFMKLKRDEPSRLIVE